MINIKIFTLILFYYINYLSSQLPSICKEGCLRCININTPQEQCEICDSISGYIKNGKSCSKNIIQNCLISFELNTCYQCKTGYYLNGQQKCIKLDTKSALNIQNCNEYGKIDEC